MSQRRYNFISLDAIEDHVAQDESLDAILTQKTQNYFGGRNINLYWVL